MNNNLILQSCMEMQEIAAPLKKYFDINFFGHLKLQANSYIALTTSHHWAEWFHAHIDDNHVANIMLHNEKIGLWENRRDQTIYNIMRNDFNISNGIRFVYKHENFIELFSFASDNANRSLIEWYFNNLDVLEKFILYFKDSARLLIKSSKENSFKSTTNELINNEKIISTDTRQSFLQEISNKRFYFENNRYLTKKEMLCATQIGFGLSIKEVARKFNVSPRTVETHLIHIKEKMNARNLNEMITKLVKAFPQLFD